MKLGQQLTAQSEYDCSLVVLETACQECPLEHLGLALFDEKVVPVDQEFKDWDVCLGSSSSTSDAPWWVDVFPTPSPGNKLCVKNMSDPGNQFDECISYSDYNSEIHTIIHGPYLADECQPQCPPTDPKVFEPRCIPISSYDANIHQICGGPYYSQELCGTGCGSSSSSAEPEPPCAPVIEIITLPDGTQAVIARCADGSSSSSSNEYDSSSSSVCVLGSPPETQVEYCPNGSINYTTYFLPDFRNCTWSPIVLPGEECGNSSSSCEQARRYCLYTNFAPSALSIVFSQEDKPPPCTYRYYCLPDGCQYLCEDDAMGTPVDFCLPDCCGYGICDVNCAAYSHPNCIVCALMGGKWFYQGVGWEEWHRINCGCSGSCDPQNPCLDGCYCCNGQCQDEPCEETWACCNPGYCLFQQTYAFDWDFPNGDYRPLGDAPSASGFNKTGTNTSAVTYSKIIAATEADCSDYLLTIKPIADALEAELFAATPAGVSGGPLDMGSGTWFPESCTDALSQAECDEVGGTYYPDKKCSEVDCKCLGPCPCPDDCYCCNGECKSEPCDYVCDFLSGCVRNPGAGGGATLAECEDSCGKYWYCWESGCYQEFYYQPFFPGYYKDQDSCQKQCKQRYRCGEDGCYPMGFAESGLEDCTTCVVVEKYCNPEVGCANKFGIGDPNAPPPECPPTCDRYWECQSGYGCQQSFYYSLFGFSELQCKTVCKETFYCDNSAECQGVWSEFNHQPYDTKEECQEYCKSRVECKLNTGCTPIGYAISGYESCESLFDSDTCYHRFYCDETRGCIDQGWGPLGEGQVEECGPEYCIQYFVCTSEGCEPRYTTAGQPLPPDGFPTRELCASDCPVPGCTNPNSPNYKPFATCDDGSCLTCCNQGLCVVDDDSPCKGPNCNPVGNGCCDSGCLPCGVSGRDCSASFDNSFTAIGCDGMPIEYKSCYECGGWYKPEQTDQNSGVSAMNSDCVYDPNCGSKSSKCFDTKEECECDCSKADDGSRVDEFDFVCGNLVPIKKAIIVPSTCQGYYYEYSWCPCPCEGVAQAAETKISMFSTTECAWVDLPPTFNSCAEACDSSSSSEDSSSSSE